MSPSDPTTSSDLRVLLVEDCRTTRRYIRHLLESVDDFDVLEPATDGIEAIDKAVEHRPDVILTDLHLPRLDGVEAIATIMADSPCPIVVLSGELSRRDNDCTFEALNAGAVKVLAKPRGMARGRHPGFGDRLADTLRLMAKVEVVSGPAPPHRSTPGSFRRPETNVQVSSLDVDVVAIGASTGGPAALYELLTSIDGPFPLPLVISQHIANGFEHGLCSWLQTTGHDVEIPLPGTDVVPGKIYLSPANASLTLGPNKIEIVPAVGDEITPNIDRLFSSVARYCRERSVGVLLTGMGRDGVGGLSEMYHRGSWTIVQNREGAVVDSMPAAAAEAGVAREELELTAIGKRLQTLASTHGDYP